MIIENHPEIVLCKVDFYSDYAFEGGPHKIEFEAGKSYHSTFIKFDHGAYTEIYYNVYPEPPFPFCLLDDNHILIKPRNIITGSTRRFLVKYIVPEGMGIIGELPKFYTHFYDTIQQRKFKLQKINQWIDH